MAFNKKEESIIRWSLENGKTPQEIKDAIVRLRTTGSPRSEATPRATSERGFVEKIGEAARGGIEKVIAGQEQGESASNPLELIEGATKIGAGAIETVTSPLAPIFEPIAKGIEKVTDVVSDSPAIQEFAMSPAGEATSRVAEDVANLSTIAGTVAGGRAVAGAKIPKMAIPKPNVGVVKSFINDVRFGLSEIDPQVETVLQRSDFDEVNRYFQQARNAKTDPASVTPIELAGTKAEEAFDLISKARKDAIKGKKTILSEVADTRITGNTLNEVMASGIQRMNDRFGVSISSKGEVASAKGRLSQLDPKDQKLISEYFTRFNQLGVAPTLKQVDDFVDYAQSILYKQEKTLSKLETASDPVVRELQSITGDLNNRLKTSVGGGYAEANARITRLIELQDELSRALGADARKGGGLMKRLFSPTGGDTRRIFEEIQQETGVDLFKEATLAKFAMESVGDVRQKSLLQQLDVAVQNASELDITKPLSIIRFIRERADLDGQELANEILRRLSEKRP